MTYLLAFVTQNHPEVRTIEVSGLLPIKETFPMSLVASKSGAILTIDEVTHLVVIDKSIEIPYPDKKRPEIELVTTIGSQRETILARNYTTVEGNISKLKGVTTKGNPFEVYNCKFIALQIT